MNRPWPVMAAVWYSVLLPAVVIIGMLRGVHRTGLEHGNALNMPVVALAVALVFAACAAALYEKAKLSLYAFYIVAPPASLSLAIIYARNLWRDDIPLTIALALVYVPLTFFLSRDGSMRDLGIAKSGWKARGGLVLAVSLAAMVVSIVAINVFFTPSESAFSDSTAYYRAMNELAKVIAVCLILGVNYLGGLIAVSIKPR